MNSLGTSLRDLYRERSGKRMRQSSYDRTGGNFDFIMVNPESKKTIFDVQGPGCITHIWVTTDWLPPNPMLSIERCVTLRMYWDGEENPSVEAPIGDFFGMGHGMSKHFVSAPLSMNPTGGKAYNCWFPMPFAKGARIEVENETEENLVFYYYVDYEAYEEIDSPLRFHAQWRRRINEDADLSVSGMYMQMGGFNLTGEKNYVLLDAVGKGHYVGCNLNIHNLNYTGNMNWPGEGDDMIFIDGEPWPPRLHGTGTEDYFNTAWCPQEEYNAPYDGIILGGGANWFGKITYYRYHIQDPIMFDKSIKVTIEQGHNNNRPDDFCSTAYWYQTEPHKIFPELPDLYDRRPLPESDTDLLDMLKQKMIRDKRAKEMGLEE